MHADNCKILKADPGVQIEWSDVETGHWRAVCLRGSEDVRADSTIGRARRDPYDPSTFHHHAGCEHRHTSDPAVLRAILRVREGANGGCWYVKCAGCDCGWQVPYYAESGG
jgi:hypothetical protein